MNWNPSLREPAATSSTAMTRQARGRTQPAAVALSTTEVHLWLVHLDGSDWYPEDLVRTLSPDELRRADAFAYSQERRRFIVGRALLRRLLARYLRADPAAVVFAYGPHGKPELAPGCDLSTLRFNCAHSGPLALYAVAAGRRVGVDLEELRPLPEVAALTQLCCSPRERATLATLPRDAVEPAVLRAWTLKEAYVKATGEGLALPPEQVEVAVAPGAPPALRAVRSDARPAARWSLRSFSPVAGYTAALAVEGPGDFAVVFPSSLPGADWAVPALPLDATSGRPPPIGWPARRRGPAGPPTTAAVQSRD